MAEQRPEQPQRDKVVWYRGWEIAWNDDADYWISQGWRAYKGGCDLDAPTHSAGTYLELLDLIDDEED